jgi:two-component system sensor histidine kinase UhpB
LRQLVWVVAYSAIYGGLWHFSTQLEIIPGTVSWFLPAGTRLLALVAWPPSTWWRIWLAEGIVNTLLTSLSFDLQGFGLQLASHLLPFLCYAAPVFILLGRQRQRSLITPLFVGKAFTAGVIGAALVGVRWAAVLRLNETIPAEETLTIAAAVIVGDLVGISAVGAVVAVFVGALWVESRQFPRWLPFLAVPLALLTGISLSSPLASYAYAAKFLLLAPLLGLALTGGLFGAGIGLTFIVSAVFAARLAGQGFGAVGEDQLYLIAVTVGGLALGAALDHQVHLAGQLRRQNARLERLVEQLNRINGEYQHLAERLVTAEERERSHLARELHDGLGQVLSAARIQLATARRFEPGTEQRESALDELGPILEGAYSSAREIMDRLSPAVLRREGLRGAIEGSELATFLRGAELIFTVDFEEQLPTLSDSAALNILRIVQECANNTVRHAQATRFSVRLYTRDEALALEIGDDGKGFDNEPKQSGMGLQNIRDRVASLGGGHRLMTGRGGVVHEFRFPLASVLQDSDESKVAFLRLA